MLIDSINLNHIRIFECVYRTNSMTKAAEELFMTQSGISQHVKMLEDMLNVKLFDRVKRRLVPTTMANELFHQCSEGLYSIERALLEIKADTESLKGEIRIAVPIEFGNNIILPLLADFGKKYPAIRYVIEYGLASDINQLLLSGKFDFAFVDELPMDKMVEIIKVYSESFYLCCSTEYWKKVKLQNNINSKKFYESIDYIDFSTEGELIQTWFRYHLKTSLPKAKVRVAICDIQGMAKMISYGLGAGILTDTMLQKLKNKDFPLHIIEEQAKPLYNAISLAYVKGKTLTPAAGHLMSFLNTELKKHQK